MEGDKYRVNAEVAGFPVGTVVTMTLDDGTDRKEYAADGLAQWVYDSDVDIINVENSEMSSNVFESIVQYAVAVESNTNAYKSLAMEIVQANIHTPDMFLDHVEDGEREYMESYLADDEAAKKKDGSWKYRSYLPKAYNTGKSVLKNALECGIPIMQDGEVVGKSALEKQIKAEREEGEEEKSDYDKTIIVCETLAKLYYKLSSDEKASVDTYIENLKDY